MGVMDLRELPTITESESNRLTDFRERAGCWAGCDGCVKCTVSADPEAWTGFQHSCPDDECHCFDRANEVWAKLEAIPGFNEELRQAEAELAAGKGIPFSDLEAEFADDSA